MPTLPSILLQFPPPPQHGSVTVFEKDGQLKDFSETTVDLSLRLTDYPEIMLQNELFNRANLRFEKAQLAFLNSEESSWKNLFHVWSNEGFLKVMEEMLEANNEVPSWMVSTCKGILSFVDTVKTLSLAFFSQNSLSDEEIVSKFMHVNDWHNSPIQAIAWHPHVAKAAVALHDDSVHIFYSGNNLRPILKHKLQKQVSDIAWQPLSGSVLAVACKTCVLIWHVEPTSLAVRPSASTVQVLNCSTQVPVTSLSWSPDGDLLISASPKQNSIIIWDVPKEKGVALKRSTGGGVTFMSYSPDGSKLFTGTTTKMFRVWEAKDWQWENWSNLSGPCTAACWSPDGTVLLFAMEGETGLYAVRFTHSGDGHSVSTSVLLTDVAQVSFTTQGGTDISVGGQIKSIVWDETGERLAVMFQSNEKSNDQYVAVFKTTIHPVTELLPGGFLKGRSGESACHIAFLPNFSKGALLSVVWSSGRIGYVPMYFIPALKIQRLGSMSVGPLSPGPFLM